MRARPEPASTFAPGARHPRGDDGLTALREQALAAVCVVAVAALAPYAAIRITHGALVVGTALLGLIGLFAGTALALMRGRRPPVPAWILLMPVVAAVTLSLEHDGPSGAFWCYPFVVFAYVALSRTGAAVASVAIFVVATAMLARNGDGPAALRFFASLGLTLVVVNMALSTITGLRRQLTDRAMRDPLTGAFNRRHMDVCLADAVERLGRTGAPASVVLFDVDHFKRINDLHGHAAGDAVLVGLASLVRGRLRRLDVLCRVGGEEFVLLLPDTRSAEARLVAEQIRMLVASEPWPGGPVTVSAGVSELAPDEPPGAWLRRADEWLYVAKREGRNRVMGDGGHARQPDLPYPEPPLVGPAARATAR